MLVFQQGNWEAVEDWKRFVDTVVESNVANAVADQKIVV